MSERPVLFLNSVGTLGGGERFLLDLIAMLRAIRPEQPLHVIAGSDGPLVEEAIRVGATAETLPMPEAAAAFGDSSLQGAGAGRIGRWLGTIARATSAGLAMPPYLRALRRRVAALEPRLVHSNSAKTHLIAGFVTPRSTPLVWHIHDFLSTRPIVGRALRLARAPNVAIANSDATAADFRRALPGVRTMTVHNGIDADRFCPGPADPAELDRLAGMPTAPSGTIRVGLVATYARWKGQNVFLEAAAQVVRTSSVPVRFYIIGGPVYRTAGSQFSESELRQRITTLGLEDRVGLVPFQRELPAIYRAFDIVVHASTRPEPFGLTIVEAMACGRAVIVSKAGGAAELFTDGEDALGAVPGDVGDFAANIRRLLIDPALRARLGQRARETVSARFTCRRMADAVQSIYDSIRSPS